jgi:uncharacterized repeat protein (TIGR03803 family)
MLYRLRYVSAAWLTILLCSCGGGGGGSAPPPPPVSNVTFYSVGGNLAGLTGGQQVTLQNNGADPLTLMANGTFTFPTQIAQFDAYSVSVSSQPDRASLQFCSVSSGSGRITAAVTNVQVACNTESVLYGFTSATSGSGQYPLGGLIMDSAGNLYGTTTYGGIGFGVVFKLSPVAGGGYTESVLHAFGDGIADGGQPAGTLTMDSAGSIYGATTAGGSGGYGVVFKLLPAAGGGYTASILHAFDGTTADGGEPTGGLVMDGAGDLYGTTRIGGASQAGVVFELSPSQGGGYTETILYSFTGDLSGPLDGAQPEAGLLRDTEGNLYGTTSTSSSNSGYYGAVFKLTPGASGYTETTLHTFSAGLDGVAPAGALIMDSAGNLYGTTRLGSGQYGIGYGTVFKLTLHPTNKYIESVLYSFTGGSDGAQPLAGLVMDSAGNLYGTTSTGGGNANCNNGCGTVFKLSGSNETVLFSFSGGSGGAGPAAGLVIDSVGNLYGTTNSGQGAGVTGGTDAGNIFEILIH